MAICRCRCGYQALSRQCFRVYTNQLLTVANRAVHADCSGIGDEGCKALAKGLKMNRALTSIDLSCTHRCLHGRTQLSMY
eukprot:5397250-Pleurochrysis_carterae.AAC.1